MMDSAEAERSGLVSRVVANDKLIEEGHDCRDQDRRPVAPGGE